MFRINTQKISIDPNKKVIKAEDYLLYLKANEIIAKAEEKAKSIIEDAEKVFEERKQEGYDEGILEGKLEASEKMLDTTLAAVDYLEHLEQSLVDIVQTAVRKVIGDIDDKERIVKVVQNALLKVHSQQKILVKVSPEDEKSLRESLELMLKSSPDTLSFLDIIADPRMKKGDCILESELGILDASLETQ